MKKVLSFKDFEFGDIDARHEILARDEGKRRLFLDSFTAPESFKINDLFSGEKFIICGPKGSGKTAFLRYLQHQLNERPDSFSRFIVFRDDIAAQDRDKIVKLSQFRSYTSEEVGEEELGGYTDCLNAWQLFIHREIADVISRSKDLCAKTPEVIDYIKLMNSVFSQFQTSAFKKLVKSITKGKIKLSGLGQGLEAEAEFVDKHGNLDVSEFVRYCNSVIENLDFNSDLKDPRINIFFDELNINFVSGKDFKNNALLLRDLVAACGTVNLRFAEHGVPIYVYTALRSEVADSVESNVRELQKWIDDKGVQINWIISGQDYAKQPFIKLLERRIAANEKRLLDLPQLPSKVDLSLYFEREIAGYPSTHFLVFETWGRPRDLVRMLKITAEASERGDKFGTKSFKKSLTKYSQSCWDEKKDELNAKYSHSMIEVLKRTLTGFETTFSRSKFDSRVTFSKNNDPRANQFFEGRNVDLLLEDLFKVGVVGNLTKLPNGTMKPNFLYTGHTNFSPNGTMCIHRSLWRVLSLEPKPNSIGRQVVQKKRYR